jgi:hypothetical protein
MASGSSIDVSGCKFLVGLDFPSGFLIINLKILIFGEEKVERSGRASQPDSQHPYAEAPAFRTARARSSSFFRAA